MFIPLFAPSYFFFFLFLDENYTWIFKWTRKRIIFCPKSLSLDAILVKFQLKEQLKTWSPLDLNWKTEGNLPFQKIVPVVVLFPLSFQKHTAAGLTYLGGIFKRGFEELYWGTELVWYYLDLCWGFLMGLVISCSWYRNLTTKYLKNQALIFYIYFIYKENNVASYVPKPLLHS